MRFYCYKCCDEIQTEPCILTIARDPCHTKKDVMVGLTMCPFEGCNYNKGTWVKNGEHYAAEWGKKR
jgi:hypothetical protein